MTPSAPAVHASLPMYASLRMYASLPMYDFPEIREHTDLVWGHLAAAARRNGLGDVPSLLTRPDGLLVDHWRRDDIFLSHTCGYPLVRALPNVHVLGSFSVEAGRSRPGYYRSVIVARADDPRSAIGLAAFDGAPVAANGDDSLSGWVSLGWAMAEAGISAGPITFTGAHALSVLAVRDGIADAASIDAHSYALFSQHRPDSVAGLIVIGHGPEVAVTPLITARGELVDPLRAVVAEAVESLPQESLRALMITGWVPHGRAEHEPVKALAERALTVLPSS
jgi:ABC-type phosphate/phosphonate transport system substrate-binding protein